MSGPSIAINGPDGTVTVGQMLVDGRMQAHGIFTPASPEVDVLHTITGLDATTFVAIKQKQINVAMAVYGWLPDGSIANPKFDPSKPVDSLTNPLRLPAGTWSASKAAAEATAFMLTQWAKSEQNIIDATAQQAAAAAVPTTTVGVGVTVSG